MTPRVKEDLKEIAYTFPESFYDEGDDDIEYDDASLDGVEIDYTTQS